MKKIKILYIEDSAENRLLVRRVLEAENYEVLDAEDGPAGIKKAESECPDLILMDIMMPGMDGREVTTRLRGILALKKTPIVALTANVIKGEKERALVAGCDGYLQKPIDVDRFVEQLQGYLNGKQESLTPEEEIVYLRQYNKRLAEHLELKTQRLSSLTEINKQLSNMSFTDELTGLPNRRYLNRRLREEMALSRRIKNPFACIMVDLDHFKQINDSLGHLAGDGVLQSVAKILSVDKRDYDVVGRYGGEEFLLLLPQVHAPIAKSIAERLKNRVERTDLLTGTGKVVHLTISLGIAIYNLEETLSEDELILRSDQALYQAKAEGRNRIVLFGENKQKPSSEK
ncbi:MAG: GGDEF domain-containing response regulator [Nitrospiria bacterium]